MKKIYKITGCTTDVHEESYKDGEGVLCNIWSIWSICDTNAPLELKEYPSLKELLTEVGEKYLILPYKQKAEEIEKYWFQKETDLKDELRFDNDCMVDVYNRRIDDNDLAKWKNGKMKLYNAHTVLYVKAFLVEDVKLEDMEKDVKDLKIEYC